MYDVVVIGAGVIGGLISRELSKFKIKTCILEKDSSVCNETSKANSSIVHAGFDAKQGSLKAKFNVSGNFMMEQVCADLGVEFKRIGSLVLAFTDEDVKTLEHILENGTKNGVPELSIISSDELQKIEPNISKDVKAALLAKTGGITCPYKLTHRSIENAINNGVELKTEQKVISIEPKENKFIIKTNTDTFEAKIIINAAGIYSDEIAKLAGDDTFSIHPRKGQYMLYDKKLGTTVKHTIFQTPTKMGKGILVTPTVDGNLLVGPNAEDLSDRQDHDTSLSGLDEILKGAQKSVPMISKRDVITSFAGLRAVSSTDDFIIGESTKVKNFINAAGIQSPGLSASPSIAVFVAELVNDLMGGLAPNENFNPIVKSIPNILTISEDELQKIIAKNPKYGNVVCRCETVTEGEIADMIHRGCGDLDSIKRTTRAGMGRCQGGFCMPRVLEIISKEKGIPFTSVTKDGNGSYVLVGETKVGDYNA